MRKRSDGIGDRLRALGPRIAACICVLALALVFVGYAEAAPKVYVDFKGLDARTDMSQEEKDAVKEQTKNTIKENLDEAFGECNTEVTDDAAQKDSADRTVTIENKVGHFRDRSNEHYYVWGSWYPGSKNGNVYLKNFMNMYPSSFKTGGDWDPAKLGTGLGTTAAHEVAHSFSATHDNSNKNKMNSKHSSSDLASGQDLNDAAEGTMQDNKDKGPCDGKTDYSTDSCLANWWSNPTCAAGEHMTDPGAIDTTFGFSGPLASMFDFGWWGLDTDNGALDGNIWGDFVYKSSMTGTTQDADLMTFFDEYHTHFVLRGRAATPYDGQLFDADPSMIALSDPVTRPDGLIVNRQIEIRWLIDGDPGPDVIVTMSTEAFGPDSPEFSGFTLGIAEPPSIGSVKSMCDGTFVALAECPVTAQFTDHFYVESLDRSSGIRVNWPFALPPMPVSAVVTGDVMIDPSGERCIEAFDVLPAGIQEVTPMAMSNQSVGGGDFEFVSGLWGAGQQGVVDGVGLNNIGLLARTCGTVVEKDPSPDQSWFRIDDGSGLGLKVAVPAGVGLPNLFEFVSVTGVSSCEKAGDVLYSVVKARYGSDIEVVTP